ncbi:MAG: DUF3786 domain-containing protein [Lachnospiraceae bacterium]|nr:DUF3786 domain-containing protein [Lachnospiraceae bacterium]
MCGNSDMMEETSRKEFLTCDQDMLIRKFGLESDEHFLYIRFLNDEYAVDRKFGFISPKGTAEQAPHIAKMAIYDLLCYHKDDPCLPALSGEWKSVADLGGIIGASHAKRLHSDAIVGKLAGKCDFLRSACEERGGKAQKGGDVSYLLPVFDFFPVWFQFWDADDEFPADVRFLWDANSEAFIHYEILYYVTAHIEELFGAQEEETAAIGIQRI